MSRFRKKIYVAAGFTTLFFGPGRKEFNPKCPMPPFENYLKETATGSLSFVQNFDIDEGVIGSFMSQRFINQGNLSGFLPFMVPSLEGKPCTAVEGACGTGARAVMIGVRSILSDLSNSVFVSGFEMQNTMKAVYGADVLAGAGYYRKERKEGYAYFFPGVFAKKAHAYYEKYGYEKAREAMAFWYKQAIEKARKNTKAQEYHNQSKDLLSLGRSAADPQKFLPYLNLYDCSKVSDGASSLILFSEEGLQKAGVKKQDAVELVAIEACQSDITKPSLDETLLSTTVKAVKKALSFANISLNDIAVLEIHDCFTITALLSFEAIGFAEKGKAPDFILEGNTEKEGIIPTNLSGGLIGFGHPTGATGVRQIVDLLYQLTGKAENQAQITKPYGMSINMGGNDKTVTCTIVKKVEE